MKWLILVLLVCSCATEGRADILEDIGVPGLSREERAAKITATAQREIADRQAAQNRQLAFVVVGAALGVLILMVILQHSLKEKPQTSKAESPPTAATIAINPNLHPCPDCGRQVSKLATTCPQCGRPLMVVPPPRNE